MKGTGQTAAVFLDRDGTLIEDRGDLGSVSEVALLPGALPALRELGRHFTLFLVTHQPGVARGVLTLEQVAAVNTHLLAELARAGVRIRQVFVCPHVRSDGCDCIKPKPWLLRRAAEEHGIDLSRSYTVGDHPHDVELAKNVGATGVYVLTGHGLRHLGDLGLGHVVVPNMAAAAKTILQDTETPTSDPLVQAARVLQRGGLVAFPTETVYGLGASALDPRAVARIFAVKGRPTFDPLIVHIAELSAMVELVARLPAPARQLAEHFWPGPLTMVLRKSTIVPDIVTAGLPTVAIRMPAHPLALRLIQRAGVPIAAPSANLFGRVSPTRLEHVEQQLGGKVDVLLDGGACRVGLESTIVSLVEEERPILLRPGGTPLEALESVLGVRIAAATAEQPVSAPGMLLRHYAPTVPLSTFRGEIPLPRSHASGLLLLGPRAVPSGYARVDVLSETHDLAEAGSKLFAALRNLETAGLDGAVAELAADAGIGLAINDRLTRAARRAGAEAQAKCSELPASGSTTRPNRST